MSFIANTEKVCNSSIEMNPMVNKKWKIKYFQPLFYFFPPTVNCTGLWDIPDIKGYTSALLHEPTWIKAPLCEHWIQMFLDAFLLLYTT